MEAINLKGTYDTPSVILDPDNDHFEISGRSYPEDTAEFYIPILEWLSNYIQHPNKQTNFVFKLDYFNSSSYKPFLDMFLKLAEAKEKGHEINIEWFYKEGDWDIKEAGEEFSEIVEVPFEYSSF